MEKFIPKLEKEPYGEENAQAMRNLIKNVQLSHFDNLKTDTERERISKLKKRRKYKSDILNNSEGEAIIFDDIYK